MNDGIVGQRLACSGGVALGFHEMLPVALNWVIRIPIIAGRQAQEMIGVHLFVHDDPIFCVKVGEEGRA